MPTPRTSSTRRDRDDRGAGADERHRDRAQAQDRDAAEGHAAAAEAIGQAPGDRHRDQHAETLRTDQQARCDQALVTDFLVVERHQDHRAEQRRAERERRERRGREDAVRVQADVEQRALDAQRVPAEDAAISRSPASDRREDDRRRQAGVGRAELGEAVDDRARRRSRAAPGRARRGARPRPIRSAGCIRQPSDEREEADRHVDEEDPRPVQALEDRARRRPARGSGRASRASRRPPSRGPSAAGPATWAMISCATGMIMPPPAPCSTRNSTSSVVLVAIAHSAEPTVNSTSEIMYTRFAPNRRAAQPVIGITAASDSR